MRQFEEKIQTNFRRKEQCGYFQRWLQACIFTKLSIKLKILNIAHLSEITAFDTNRRNKSVDLNSTNQHHSERPISICNKIKNKIEQIHLIELFDNNA